MNSVKPLVLTIVLAIATLPTFASEKSTAPQPTGNRLQESSGWFLSVGHLGLDSEQASKEGIGSDAFNFTGGFEGHKDKLAYSFGLNFLILSDKDRINNTVVDQNGRISSASSSASAYGGFGELGYSHTFESGNTSFDLMAGVEFLSASRTIASCSNCDSESISLDSGLYIKPKFNFYKDNGLTVGLAYQHYLSGDLNGGISLSFSWQG